MRIEEFLPLINYKIKSGEIYNGKDTGNHLLYWIHFMNPSEKHKGKLLLSAKNQQIFLIEYQENNKIYLYKKKFIEYDVNNKNINSLKDIIKIITSK